ncbi:MAG: hypothetical protein GX491_07095 [Chloroflexi bacterium]|nr:hypothetical protein [Chloroflexota bacterium]
MKSKFKVNKLESKAKSLVENKHRVNLLNRFLDAHSRNMVLCKDGVERSFEDWAKRQGVYDKLELIWAKGNET